MAVTHIPARLTISGTNIATTTVPYMIANLAEGTATAQTPGMLVDGYLPGSAAYTYITGHKYTDANRWGNMVTCAHKDLVAALQATPGVTSAGFLTHNHLGEKLAPGNEYTTMSSLYAETTHLGPLVVNQSGSFSDLPGQRSDWFFQGMYWVFQPEDSSKPPIACVLYWGVPVYGAANWSIVQSPASYWLAVGSTLTEAQQATPEQIVGSPLWDNNASTNLSPVNHTQAPPLFSVAASGNSLVISGFTSRGVTNVYAYGDRTAAYTTTSAQQCALVCTSVSELNPVGGVEEHTGVLVTQGYYTTASHLRVYTPGRVHKIFRRILATTVGGLAATDVPLVVEKYPFYYFHGTDAVSRLLLPYVFYKTRESYTAQAFVHEVTALERGEQKTYYELKNGLGAFGGFPTPFSLDNHIPIHTYGMVLAVE